MSVSSQKDLRGPNSEYEHFQNDSQFISFSFMNVKIRKKKIVTYMSSFNKVKISSC